MVYIHPRGKAPGVTPAAPIRSADRRRHRSSPHAPHTGVTGMKKHVRDEFYVLGEGILTQEGCQRPSTTASLRKFRFSRLGPQGEATSPGLITKLAAAMTAGPEQGDDRTTNRIPAGYTYLGQFVDHDMTMDVTRAALGTDVSVDELLQ